MRALGALRGKKTIIVIAHRLVMVTNCDQVYVLEQGRVRISGVYAELVSTDPAFQELSVKSPSDL